MKVREEEKSREMKGDNWERRFCSKQSSIVADLVRVLYGKWPCTTLPERRADLMPSFVASHTTKGAVYWSETLL